MAQGRLRPVIIVWPDQHDLCERFAQRLRGIIPVFLDRRAEKRRRAHAPVESDLRTAERRHLLTRQGHDRFRALGYRLVYPPQAYQESGGDVYALAFCAECERILDFTMPRFVEPPAHVETVVQHLLSAAGRARHVVDLEASMPSGRILLTCRINAREVDNPEGPA